MSALESLPGPTPIRAVICLIVGAVLWPADTVEAQAGRPSVVAEVVTGSLARSAEELSFRIAVEVPAGHHGYIDKGDDGFLIPFSFSFPGLGGNGRRGRDNIGASWRERRQGARTSASRAWRLRISAGTGTAACCRSDCRPSLSDMQ